MKKFLITTTALVALCAHAKAATLNVLEEGVLVSHGKAFEAVHGATEVQPGDLVKVQKSGKATLVSDDGKSVTLNKGVTRISKNLFLDASNWQALAEPAAAPAAATTTGTIAGIPTPLAVLGAVGVVGGVVGGTVAATSGNGGGNDNGAATALAIAASQKKVSQ